jgi:choline dehydrogenase-like flavoprotein
LSYQGAWQPSVRSAFLAAHQVGFNINSDVNDGNPIGMGIGPACIFNGTRVTAASAYLQGLPNNLTVRTSSLVARVLFAGGVATGVELVTGERYHASKEVILSGGAINSPQILLLSGVGPGDELRKHGIAIECELPQVGKNLQDHCFTSAGIVLEGTCKELNSSQSPSPMAWTKVHKLLGSKEFQALPEDTQRYMKQPTVPSWEMATVSLA